MEKVFKIGGKEMDACVASLERNVSYQLPVWIHAIEDVFKITIYTKPGEPSRVYTKFGIFETRAICVEGDTFNPRKGIRLAIAKLVRNVLTSFIKYDMNEYAPVIKRYNAMTKARENVIKQIEYMKKDKNETLVIETKEEDTKNDE